MKRQRLLLMPVLAVCLTLSSPAIAHEGHNSAFSAKTETKQAPKVHLSKESQKLIGLQTLTVRAGALEQVLQTTGKVQAAENKAYDITPRVTGAVSRVYAQQGDFVRAGQTLASIYSAEAAGKLAELLQERARLQAEVAKTRTQYQGDIAIEQNHVEVARVAFQREQALLNEGITSKKDYLEAQHALEDAQIKLGILKKQSTQQVSLLQKQLALTVSALHSQLRVLGLSSAAINQALSSNRVTAEIPIASPVSGTVTFRDVTAGETIEPGQKIFSIVGLSPIWVVMDIFQEQIPKVRTGQTVRLKTPSNMVMDGQISSIGSVVDPNQRTLPVRVVSQNPGGVLKPGMFVSAEIVTGKTSGNQIVIPATALVDDNGRKVVYVQYNDDFQAVPVQTGQQTANDVEIRDGLYEGDTIVVQGASQIRAQGLLAGSEEKSQDEKLEGKADHHNEHAVPLASWPSMILGVLIGLTLAGLSWLWMQKRSEGRR